MNRWILRPSFAVDCGIDPIDWYRPAYLIPSIAAIELENDRITCIVTEDEDRLIKNPISTNCDVEQILYQICETVAELSRRIMRTCRYKAVECNVIHLVEQYNFTF